MKTERGFEVQHFKDDHGTDCSIQDSSIDTPHIWLGVHEPEHLIMWKDAEKYGIKIHQKRGWYPYPIPEEVLVKSRMHLNQKQARELAHKLLYFAEMGHLEEEQ